MKNSSKIDAEIVYLLKVWGELSAFELLDRLNCCRRFKLGFGHLYPSLFRLEKQGSIAYRVERNVTEGKTQTQNYYRLEDSL